MRSLPSLMHPLLFFCFAEIAQITGLKGLLRLSDYICLAQLQGKRISNLLLGCSLVLERFFVSIACFFVDIPCASLLTQAPWQSNSQVPARSSFALNELAHS